ncbi:MAG: LacI family DNA-binding transcriptional regulator [Oscillospiraceae bacterium]
MRIKSKDLAKLLGVSTATISLLLNNKPGLSDELRSRLTEQIKDLGYGNLLPETTTQMPTILNATTSGKKTIAYIVYTFYDNDNDNGSFFPAVLEGVETEARERGYDVRVLHMGRGVDCTPRKCLNREETLGMIVQLDFLTDEIADELAAVGLPFVVLDSYRYDRRISAVCVNNEDGIFNAVKFLVNHGHTQIGYVASGRDTNCFIDRRRCFHLAMREYKLQDRPEFRFFAGGFDCSAVSTLAKQWETLTNMPTALIVENDTLAWRAMKALKKLNYRIPEDISIIGFDDKSIASLTDPPLTTIRVHRALLGREAVIMLDNHWRLEKSGFLDVPSKLSIGVTFIERESAGIAKQQ